MEKMRFETKNITDENIQKILELFPNVATEAIGDNGELKTAIDFDKLKQELSEVVIDGEESYNFTWVGKKEAMVEANRPIRKTLRPDRESSVDWENTQNIYIEGDNLEALKLLQESYLGKVKMIYIDPPYNTGNDFVYRDNFTQDKESYDEELGVNDEEGNRLFQNTESNGRFHSDWCSMIYSRLKLARNLLSDDGIIFISMDDCEVKNLRNICNEVFGEDRFINAFIWQKTFRPSNFTKTTRKNTEYVLCYTKSDIELQGIYEESQGDFSLTKKKHNTHILTLPSNYVEAKFDDGIYKKGDYGAGYVLLDDIIVKNGTIANEFRLQIQMSVWSQEYLQNEISKGVYLVIKNKSTMALYARKIYQQNELKPTTLIPSEIVGDVLEGNAEISRILGKEIFDYPKPSSLIRYLITICKNNRDTIVLDFFSGSATTAHAVMQLNAEDDGNRKFIMVQLPEKTDEKSEAYKAGYKNICEIGKERIRRAGKKIQEENPDKKIDVGFRVFKVDDTNMKDVYYTPSEFTQQKLKFSEKNIKEDRTDEDLLYGCLLDWGVELSLPHRIEVIDGRRVHIVDEDALIACFEKEVPETVMRKIAEMKPTRVVFKDGSFVGDANKINVEEIFKLISPETTVKVI